ncbi:1-pyrroline-5-carboxylate dehydrogenase, partial [Reticulomyxa filosa]
IISEHAIKHPDLAGVTFTGSTAVFRQIWETIGSNIGKYKSFPRLVGETGGKNFHLVHASADIDNVVNGTIRGAFEYQGQKCSATSRMKNCWRNQKIKMGQPDDFDVFMTAVIDGNAFRDISAYIEHAKNDKSCNIIVGGACDSSKGYFISPTIIETTDPKSKTMREEIFGPVLTVYVYDDDQFEETIDLLDQTAEYALTGSLYARDRKVIELATRKLRHSAGNFYVNDKSTGAIVAQQPFGGSRASGTNDKAGWGTIFNRFVSMRAIKESYLPTSDWKYPHMKTE